jgi:N-dimethylarginine dimethylaminohydrolase
MRNLQVYNSLIEVLSEKDYSLQIPGLMTKISFSGEGEFDLKEKKVIVVGEKKKYSYRPLEKVSSGLEIGVCTTTVCQQQAYCMKNFEWKPIVTKTSSINFECNFEIFAFGRIFNYKRKLRKNKMGKFKQTER